MKRIIFSFLILTGIVFLSSCSKKPELKGTFNTTPEKSKAGEELTVYYSSDSTNLAKADSIDMICYQYGEDVYSTKAVPMFKENNHWTGKINLSDSTKGVLINFKNGDNIDNNKSKGYVVFLYGDNGKYLPGSRAGFGNAINTWGSWYANLDRDASLAMNYFNTDFKENPDIKYDYLDGYLNTIMRAYKEPANNMINNELKGLAEKNPTSEKYLSNLAIWYGRIHNAALANKYKAIVLQKYPKSEFTQRIKYSEFNNEQDIDKKVELEKKFEKDFPKSDYLQNMIAIITNYYRDKNQYNKAYNFLKAHSEKASPYTNYSLSAVMLKNKADVKVAMEIAKMGVDKSKKDYENPTDEKPNYQTKGQWKDDRAYLFGMNLYSYGKALNILNKNKEALNSLDKAVYFTKKQDGDVNSLYASLLIQNKKYDEILSKIPDFIKEGNDTPNMANILEEAYVNKNGSKKGFKEYFEGLKDAARSNLIAKLKKEMVDKDAPDFTLTDLNDNVVSLSELKGKTVVLDFWATWCGPCKASFPGMQKALEKYSKNENIKFLFVDAWERVPNKKDNAEKFIKEHQYPFHVLLDQDNKVIDSYKVTGIPTKFIIDKNGKIRFTKIGYAGNEDQLVDEISTMISLVD